MGTTKIWRGGPGPHIELVGWSIWGQHYKRNLDRRIPPPIPLTLSHHHHHHHPPPSVVLTCGLQAVAWISLSRASSTELCGKPVSPQPSSIWPAPADRIWMTGIWTDMDLGFPVGFPWVKRMPSKVATLLKRSQMGTNPVETQAIPDRIGCTKGANEALSCVSFHT